MPTTDELEARVLELERVLDIAVRALNPPMTIGELTDVPTPGSQIAAQWAQEVSGRVAHHFASAAARDAAWPANAGNKGALSVTLDTTLLWVSTGTTWRVQDGAPVGTIRSTVAAVADIGWLLMDGASYQSTDYPALYAIVPASWKAGGLFSLPSLYNTALIGSGNEQGGGVVAIGQRYGSNSLVLTTAQLPSHSHSINGDGTHHHNANNPNVFFHINHVLAASIGKLSTTGNAQDTEAFASTSIVTDDQGAHSHGGATGAVGAGTALDMRQSSMGINYQIKAG